MSVLDGLTRPARFGAVKNPPPHSPVRIQNRIRLRVLGPDGKVKHETPWRDNILTTFGLASLASAVGSSAAVTASSWIQAIAIGTGVTAAASTDVSLANSTASITIGNASFTKTNTGNRTVEYQATFASNNPAGAAVINEVALFCQSTAALSTHAAARSVLGTASVNKLASDVIQLSYQVVWTTA